MNRIPRGTIFLAAVVLAILALRAVAFEVRFSEKAVKTRFGQVVRTIEEPGLYFRIPLLESYTAYDARMRTLSTNEAEIKTGDQKNLIVGCYAVYRIADVERYYTAATSDLEVRRQVRARLNQARNTVVGMSTMADFLNLDEAALGASRNRIREQMTSLVSEGLMQDFGIELVKFDLRRKTLPSSAAEKVAEQMVEERNRRAEQIRTEGESIAQAIRAKADSQREQILAFASRRAAEISTAGIASSTPLLQEIEDSGERELYALLQLREAAREVFKQGGTLIINSDHPLATAIIGPFVDNDESASRSSGRDSLTQATTAPSSEERR